MSPALDSAQPEPAPGPVLLRVAECGPPPEPAPVYGWRSMVQAELPVLPSRPVTPEPESAESDTTGTQRAGTKTGTHTAPRRRTANRRSVTEDEARRLAGATARAVLEVLGGRRPAQQLRAVLDGRTVTAVQSMLHGAVRWPVRHAVIVTVRVQQPSPRTIEACVVFRCERRHRALALRMDRRRERWLGTAIRIG